MHGAGSKCQLFRPLIESGAVYTHTGRMTGSLRKACSLAAYDVISTHSSHSSLLGGTVYACIRIVCVYVYTYMYMHVHVGIIGCVYWVYPRVYWVCVCVYGTK